MINRHPVSDTAALVMLWAAAYYQRDPLVRTYLERLDLSAGRAIFNRYNQICPWYSEVIINRKHFICNTVRDLAGQTPGNTTIVNLGAGFSPLALELAPLLSPSCHFIELDKSGMDRKHSIYADLVPECYGYIMCREADITDTSDLRDVLQTDKPSHLIVIMEGLSYYVPRKPMKQVIATLAELFPALSLIFEHLKPCSSISEDRRYIPYEIFSHVRDYTGMDRMTTYTRAEILAILPPDSSFHYVDMDEMEKRRTGCRTYFPAPDSGWLSCAVAVRNGA